MTELELFKAWLDREGVDYTEDRDGVKTHLITVEAPPRAVASFNGFDGTFVFLSAQE